VSIAHLFSSLVNRGSLESSDLLRGIVDMAGRPTNVISNANVNWHNENVSRAQPMPNR
jgi:hypothetical protein